MSVYRLVPKFIGLEASCAANTLVCRGDGWCAHNTDAVGFMLSLVLALNLQNEKYLKGRKILVIGAGGVAVGMYPDTHREPLPWWSPAG